MDSLLIFFGTIERKTAIKKIKFISVMVMMAFATQRTKGQSTISLRASPSINVTHASSVSYTTSVNVSKTTASATMYEKRSTQNTYIYQTSTMNIMPTPSSRMTISSSSISLNNNTHGPPVTTNGDDMEGKITLYLLVACVGLFVIIIIILIILVVQMKRLTNKLRR